MSNAVTIDSEVSTVTGNALITELLNRTSESQPGQDQVVDAERGQVNHESRALTAEIVPIISITRLNSSLDSTNFKKNGKIAGS